MLICLGSFASAQAPGEIEIDLIDSKTGQPLTCRVQLRGPNGNNLKPRASIDAVNGWSLVDRRLAFRGRAAEYTYDVFHGPEYAPAHGRFILDRKSEAVDSIQMIRHADLASEGWLGADLLSHLPDEQIARWLSAEELFLATTTMGSSYLDQRPGSGLSFHHWKPDNDPEQHAPSGELIVQSKNKLQDSENGTRPVHIEIQKLWARDLPIWLASGRIDSVQLLSDHLTIDGKASSEINPLVMPEGNFKGGRAAGRIVEQIYWMMLEAGLRIPATAGSGFGKTPSPLGYNRVYALTGSQLPETWWKAVQAGNTFVTNGPLLRVNINGMPPGYTFHSSDPIELEIGVALTVSDPVEYLEVIHNGTTLYKAALNEFAKQGGKIPTLSVDQAGWLVVRVITGREHTYRMATTSPFYFEIGDQPRIKKRAVEFFQKWLRLARKEIDQLPAEFRLLHEPFVTSAEKFWESKLLQAQP